MYDYVIIGAGPCGLTLAWCLAQYKKKILIIERENSIGGCHRVNRVNAIFSQDGVDVTDVSMFRDHTHVKGMFTEHGPRIYLDNAKTFKFILDDMGLSFEKLFTKYDFGGLSIAKEIIKHMTVKEMFVIIIAYMKFIINSNEQKKTSMETFMTSNNFTQTTKDYIDKLCRITDGAGIDRYTVYEFLEIINQNFLYGVYQPVLPNDIGLFTHWYNALMHTRMVDIWLNSEVIDMNCYDNNDLIDEIIVMKEGKMTEVKNSTYIFAIPPKNFINLLANNKCLNNAFGDFKEYAIWQKNTEYLVFIPIVFHWNIKLNLKRIWGVPTSDWGLAFVILSNYMNFNDRNSKTVISTCVTLPEKRSTYLNKFPNDCSKDELISEVFRQLKTVYSDLPQFSLAYLSPEMYKSNNKWMSRDSAYVRTKDDFKDVQSVMFKNLYSVGTHNGNHFYNFTSIESAASNAVALLNDLIPKSKKKYRVKSFITLKHIVTFIGIILIIYVLYKISKSK